MHIFTLEYQRITQKAQLNWITRKERRKVDQRFFGSLEGLEKWERGWFGWKGRQRKESEAHWQAARCVELVPDREKLLIEIYSAEPARREKASAEHKQLVAEALDELEKSGQLQNLSTWKGYK